MILDITNYENHSLNFEITSKEIEKLCLYYELNNNYPRYKETERNDFPLILPIFYWSIDKRTKWEKKLLTQDELWYKFEHYYNKKNLLDKYKQKKSTDIDLIEGARGRVHRTYTSLIRDLHFLCFLREKLGMNSVLYNMNLDTKDGIDILIIDNEKYYGIELLVDTKRSTDFKKEKDENRHKKFSNVTYIEIPKSTKEFNFGVFYLYGEEEYNSYIAPKLNNK